MSEMKGLIIAVEAIVLLILGAASIVAGRLLGAAILIGLASLAGVSAWALWPARSRTISLAGERPRRAGSNPRRRH